MGSPNYKWRYIAVCAMTNMWLVGCNNNNKYCAPISSVGGYSANAVTVERTPQLSQPQTTALISSSNQRQMNVSTKGNIIYNRSYDNIHKCSYSGETYQVKRGDTLFYIAWITGNNYQHLAQINNISKPYNLNIGQILRVDNKTTPIANNTPTGTVLASNTYQAQPAMVVTPLPITNTQSTDLMVYSNKNNYNNHPKEKCKHSLGKTLPTTGAIVTTNEQIAKPSETPATTASISTTITGWRWPTYGKIIDNFSAAEGGNKGLDISGSRGQPILATANGRVVYAGNALRGYGNLIIIKHNDDYLSAYAHNDTLLVHDQQQVKAKQKIATMGSTGTSTTKLHFEIRYKGKSVDPMHYLPQQ